MIGDDNDADGTDDEGVSTDDDDDDDDDGYNTYGTDDADGT